MSYDDDDIDGAPLNAEDVDGAPLQPLATMDAAALAAQQAAAAAAHAYAMQQHAAYAAATAAQQHPPSVPSAPISFTPAVAASKIALFEHGPTSKPLNPFQKKQAEAEEKRKRAEEEAAKVYATFVESFEADHSSSSSSRPGRSGGSSRGGAGSGSGSSSGSRPMPHKAFVSGGIIGGDPTAPKPMDPAALKASLPSTSAPAASHSSKPFEKPASSSITPTKPLPFLSSTSSITASPHHHPNSSSQAHGGIVSAFALDDDEPETPAQIEARKRKNGPKREMDSFLEELKKKAEARAAGVPSASLPGAGVGDRHARGFDSTDPTSTNIYVGNLSSAVGERELCELFVPFGDIASVKIMWARGEDALDPEASKKHCGFVSFMRRSDAEVAINTLHNTTVDGFQIKLNWSKSMPLPSQPVAKQTTTREIKEGKLKFNPTPAPSENSRTTSGNATSVPSEEMEDEFVLPPDCQKYQIEFPTDKVLKATIDLTATYVLQHGFHFEEALIERAKKGESVLNFLTVTNSVEHLYYRWKLYSLAQGDSIDTWRLKPFQMRSGGPYWIPPDWKTWRRNEEALRVQRSNTREKRRREASRSGRNKADRTEKDEILDAPTAASSEGSLHRDARFRLPDPAQKQLMDLLRHVTLDKAQIRDVMGFCLDHSEASKDVVEIITESLTIDNTQLPKKIARLYVVSDILYNSSAPIPNASSYRSLFQASLLPIFGSLHRAYIAAGRMSAMAVKEKVSQIFQAWEKWALFPTNVFQDFQRAFEKGDAATNATTNPANAADPSGSSAAPMPH